MRRVKPYRIGFAFSFILMIGLLLGAPLMQGKVDPDLEDDEYTIFRAFLWGKIFETDYWNDIGHAEDRFPSRYGVHFPLIEMSLIFNGIMLGLLLTPSLIKLRNFNYEVIRKKRPKLKTRLIIRYVLAGLTNAAGVVGFTGMMFWRLYGVLLREQIPSLKFTFVFYAGCSYFLITTIIGFIRIVFPDQQLLEFWRKNKSDSDIEKARKRKAIIEKKILEQKKEYPKIEHTADTEETINKIKSLIGEKKRIQLNWLETIILIPKEKLEEIITEKLGLRIEGDEIIQE